MQLNKTKDANFSQAKKAVAIREKQLNTAKQHLNALNTEEEDQKASSQETIVTPKNFLNQKEKIRWDRASSRKKQSWVDKEKKNAQMKHTVTSKKREVKEYQIFSEQNSAVAIKGQTKASGRMRSGSKAPANVTTLEKASTAVKASAGTATSATLGATTGGVTLAAKGARNVADKFRNALENKAIIQAENIKNAQQTAKSNIEGLGSINSFSNASSYAVNTITVLVAPILIVAVQLAAAMVSFLFILLIPLLIAVVFISIISVVLSAIFGAASSINDGGKALARVALQEYSVADKNVGGGKYKEWYQMSADWCGMFVSWCANECDFIDIGVIPKTASVNQSIAWYQAKELWKTKESGYKPKAGDIIHFTNGMSHMGIVVDYDAATDQVITVEGNTGQSSTSPYHAGSHVSQERYPRTASIITGYGTPDYPVGKEGEAPLANGETILIPSGLGSVHTYMGWQTITSPSSKQYKLREDAGQNFDAEGFGRIGNRYVIACTTTYGQVGDYVDFYKEDGSVLQCIIGDIKNQNDPGCNKWGHLNGTCIIEFVVDKASWYNGHANPGTPSCHPEWSQNVTKVVNRGSYWGNEKES